MDASEAVRQRLIIALEMAVGAAIVRQGRGHALVGGLAVSVRSEPRLTRDIDLAVALLSVITPADVELARVGAGLVVARGFGRGRDLVALLEAALSPAS